MSSRVDRHPSGVGRLGAPVPGLLLAAVIAAAATWGGSSVPVVGAPVLAVLLGLATRLVLGERSTWSAGTEVARGPVLQLAVVLLGSQLSLAQVVEVGAGSLPVMLGTLGAALAVAALAGRWFGVDRDLRTLIGVGTAVCGASAIAAVSPVVRARTETVAYAVSTIVAFNLVAVVVFPPLGHLLGLDQSAFGLFAGTAVNDTSSVVAVAAAYGPEAAQHAVVVKLTRSLMIVPIVLVLALAVRRRETRGADADPTPLRLHRLVPWFLVGFLVLAAVNSTGVLAAVTDAALGHVATVLIAVAMAGIGLGTDVRALRRAGVRPLVLGLVLWVTVGGTSLLLHGLGLG